MGQKLVGILIFGTLLACCASQWHRNNRHNLSRNNRQQQSENNPGHQSENNPGHQSENNPGHQSEKNPGHQSSGWVPMRTGIFTSARIMHYAAKHLGVRVVEELYAYRKVSSPLYRVIFRARAYGNNNNHGHINGMFYTCTAVVYEHGFQNGEVKYHSCWPPIHCFGISKRKYVHHA